MGKDRRSQGVNKLAIAGSRTGKGAGGIPLTGKNHHKSLGVNRAAAARAGGNGKGAGGWNGERSGGGAGSAMGAAGSGAGGAKGAGGRRGRGGASTFSPTDHSTFKTAEKVMNEYCDEDENHGSSEDKRSTFDPIDHSTFKTAVKFMNEVYDEDENHGSSEDERSTFEPTDHSTFKTAVKFMNECYDEEENLGLSEDEKYIQDDGAVMGNDGSGRGDEEENFGLFEDEKYIHDDRHNQDAMGNHSTFRTAEMVTKTTMGRRTEVCMRFSPTDHSTAVSVTNEYNGEEENRCSFQDAAFSPTDHGTIATAVEVMNEYHDEEENCGLYRNEKDRQDDAELLPYEDNNGAEMGDDGGYNKGAWVGGDDGAEDGIGDVNDMLNGDYYNDVVGGFDDGYDGDGGDGADDWW